jgi:hypothetical protein
MDEKYLKGYKAIIKERNPNNLNESKTIKFRKNKNKQSIDVRYEKQLNTPKERAEHFEKTGVKNEDGSITVGGNDQMITHYIDKLYSILDTLGLPSDDTVWYKTDGSIVPYGSDQGGRRLCVYLLLDRFENIPNVHRIGELLRSFNSVKNDIDEGNFERASNSLLHAIEKYSNIILISVEGDIVPHTTHAASEERTLAKVKRIKLAYRLADEIRKENPHLNTKSDIARLIAKKKDWSFDTIRQVYLKDYLIKL